MFLMCIFGALLSVSCVKTTPPPSYTPMVNTIENANPSANIQRVNDERCYMDPMFGQILACTEIRESQTNDKQAIHRGGEKDYHASYRPHRDRLGF